MTATIPIPFAIGQQLWAISSGHGETWITCPECDGTKVLTLVKGNGESIKLPAGAFKESGTGVSTRLVRMVKS